LADSTSVPSKPIRHSHLDGTVAIDRAGAATLDLLQQGEILRLRTKSSACNARGVRVDEIPI